jgi:O-antigen/teichoic acid export membrane protein
MGSVHYGELAIIQSSADLFALFAGFGLSLTATKHVAELRGKDPHRTGRILALSTLTACVTGIVMAGALFVLAPWLAKQTLAAPSLVGPLRIGACLLFFSSLSGAQCGALYGFEAFRTTAGLQAIIGVLNVPLMVGGYLVSGLNGILWGMVVGRFLEWLLRHLAVRAETSNANIAVCYRDCAREIPILWKFSLPALISGALVVPINWGCSAILVNQLNGYAEMGIYNAASQWYNALLFVPSTLGTVLLPLLSDRMGEDDRRGAVGALRFMLRFNLALMLPSVVGISLVSPYIMRMYGREYANAWPTLIVVVVTAGLFAVLMPIGDVIAASDRMWLGCLMNAGWALVLVPSTMLLVHGGWGSLGLASARLFAYSVHAVWTSLFAYKALQLAQQRTDVDDLHLVAQPTV